MSQDARNECGCCAGIDAATPGLLFNRSGLSAIAYRVGTYQTFRQSLHARLSDSRWPVLRGLRTRDDDDFTIALLDAWAVTGDILTFYQERIANEGFLRTARERLAGFQSIATVSTDFALDRNLDLAARLDRTLHPKSERLCLQICSVTCLPHFSLNTTHITDGVVEWMLVGCGVTRIHRLANFGQLKVSIDTMAFVVDQRPPILCTQTQARIRTITNPCFGTVGATRIDAHRRYAVRARVDIDGRTRYANRLDYPVLTHEAPAHVDVIVDAAQP